MNNSIFIRNISKLTLFLFILSLNFCQKNISSPVIARVGKSILTIDDLNQNIPPEYSSQITKEQNINYVKQWIDMELLYQEALRKKIDKEKEVKKRLHKMKKDLLAAEIMNRNSFQNKSLTIDEQNIHAYYELNKDNFKRENDIVKYLEIVVSDSRIAWYITKNGTPDNFITLAAEYSQQPVPENSNIPFSVLDEIQPEIRSVISLSETGSISNPVKTELGYHVIYIIDKLNKGDICNESEIREEIINQLSAKSQKENIDQLLADLRLKTSISFNPDLLKKINTMSK